MDWDDFKFVQAVARAGSVRAAGAKLGVHGSTVARHLDALEARLGTRLFARTARGMSITAAGTDVVETLERVAVELDEVQRRVRERDPALSGPVRLAAAPELVPVLLSRAVQSLLAGNPELTLEIVALLSAASIAAASLSPASASPGAVPGASPIHQDGPVETGVQARLLSREIDMALLVTEAPPQELIGRKLATLNAGVYGPPESWATWREANDAVLWIGGGDASPRAMTLRRDYFSDTPVRLRIDDVHGRRQAAEAGLGLALLPCYLGDASADLVPAPGVPAIALGDVWLLTRPDSRGVPRIQAVSTFLQTLFLQHESAFAGRSGSGSIGTNVVGAAS